MGTWLTGADRWRILEEAQGFHMNIFTHEQYIQDQISRSNRFRSIGTILIVVSLFFTFGSLFMEGAVSQLMVVLSYPLLLVGFPIWTTGRGLQRRLRNMPRADALLNQELRGFNSKYILHHYPMPGGKLIHHLMVTPSGLIVMASNDAVGPITCKDDRWKSQSNWLDRMTGTKPAIGNPTQDANVAVEAARQLLTDIGKPAAPIKGLIIFTRNPEIEVNSCSYPAAPLNEVKQAVKELQIAMEEEQEEGKQLDVMLTSEDRRRLNSLLIPQAAVAPGKAATARR
jgi:hypothetical protein